MWREVLKVDPQLDGASAAKMEAALTIRFGKIAKKFGKGLATALVGGGVIGAALAILDKIVNPLKETQEIIDRILSKSDDVVTNAKQFGTTAGKLLKLQALGQANGIDDGSLNMLIGKFQVAVAEAKADPTKQTSVRQFVGDQDTAESFLNFIQALNKMDDTAKLLVQQEVFGEKQILKMASFLQNADSYAFQFARMNARGSEEYTGPLEIANNLAGRRNVNNAGLDLEDTFQKSRLLNMPMIDSQKKTREREIELENERIRNYQNAKTTSEAFAKVMESLERMIQLLTKLVFSIDGVKAFVDKAQPSRLFRTGFGEKGK